eukprot:Rmarinus@m.20857
MAGFFGLTAETGNHADNHDIYSLQVYDLTPTEEREEIRKKYSEAKPTLEEALGSAAETIKKLPENVGRVVTQGAKPGANAEGGPEGASEGSVDDDGSGAGGGYCECECADAGEVESTVTQIRTELDAITRALAQSNASQENNENGDVAGDSDADAETPEGDKLARTSKSKLAATVDDIRKQFTSLGQTVQNIAARVDVSDRSVRSTDDVDGADALRLDAAVKETERLRVQVDTLQNQLSESQATVEALKASLKDKLVELERDSNARVEQLQRSVDADAGMKSSGSRRDNTQNTAESGTDNGVDVEYEFEAEAPSGTTWVYVVVGLVLAGVVYGVYRQRKMQSQGFPAAAPSRGRTQGLLT